MSITYYIHMVLDKTKKAVYNVLVQSKEVKHNDTQTEPTNVRLNFFRYLAHILKFVHYFERYDIK